MNDSPVDPALESTDLFFSGSDDYTMVRIPATVASPKGTLLAFCMAKNQPLVSESKHHRGVDILLRRSLDGGRTWQPVSWSRKAPATPFRSIENRASHLFN